MPEKRQKESQKKVDNEEKNDCDDDNDSVGTWDEECEATET